jgi:hypothetical protein
MNISVFLTSARREHHAFHTLIQNEQRLCRTLPFHTAHIVTEPRCVNKPEQQR